MEFHLLRSYYLYRHPKVVTSMKSPCPDASERSTRFFPHSTPPIVGCEPIRIEESQTPSVLELRFATRSTACAPATPQPTRTLHFHSRQRSTQPKALVR